MDIDDDIYITLIAPSIRIDATTISDPGRDPAGYRCNLHLVYIPNRGVNPYYFLAGNMITKANGFRLFV